MQKKNHSTKYLQQRKFLVILPVLTLPFLTLMFWALGGGRGSVVLAQSNMQKGLNLKLPDAKFKDDKTLNKLSFYQQAALDSAKTKEAEKLDPYWRESVNDTILDNGNNTGIAGSSMDANQMKVYSKLDELKKALSKSQDATGANTQSSSGPYSLKYYSSSNDADRLQSMMQNMNQDKLEDPEISQLNDMLDKIQAIQNPGATKKLVQPNAERYLPVKRKGSKADISVMKSDSNKMKNTGTGIVTTSSNDFYSFSAFDNDNDSGFNNAIDAIIPETQTIVAGSTIKLGLSNDVTIQNVTIPSGTDIYGTASLTNERLNIEITSIRFQSYILPVALTVYDMDGQEGIHIPGSINRTVAKESANNAIGEIGATTIDPSIGAQAVSAGIEAAKTLAGKKVKLIKMTVRAGYKVLLKDNHNK